MFLERLAGWKVYGDAYIFRMQKKSDGSGKATYYDLGKNFVLAVEKEKYPKNILKKLLAQNIQEPQPLDPLLEIEE